MRGLPVIRSVCLSFILCGRKLAGKGGVPLRPSVLIEGGASGLLPRFDRLYDQAPPRYPGNA